MKNLTQRHGDTESWPKVRLGEVCEVQRGGSPRPIKDFITTSDDGLNWIKIGDVDPLGKYIVSTAEKIKPSGLKKTRKVCAGEFLLSNSMSFGRPYILKVDGCIHDGWLVLRGFHDKYTEDFFYYLLRSPIVQEQFDNLAQGSTVRNLNTEAVSRVEIPLPPLPVQREIVARLEKELASVDRMEKGFEEMKAEADQLFKSTLKETFEEIAAGGAETRRLGEICDICTGKKDVRQGNPNGKYPFFTCARNPTYADVYSFDCAALLVAGNGDVGYTQKYEGKFEAYQRTYVLTHFREADIDFMHRIMQGLFGEWAHANIMGNTMPYIKMGVVKEFAFPLPPLTDQREIVAKLDAVREKCAKLKSAAEEGLTTAALLRKAILKEAFE